MKQGPVDDPQAPVRLSKNLTSMQEEQMILYRQKALGRVFPSEDGKINQNLFFSGTCASKKTLLEPASVESGRPLTRLCAQRAASPRKNACIFEKRVELFRHATGPCCCYVVADGAGVAVGKARGETKLPSWACTWPPARVPSYTSSTACASVRPEG